MYYVEVHLDRLNHRIGTSHRSAAEHWLVLNGFLRAGTGWYADAEAMNRLQIGEIKYSRAVPQATQIDLLHSSTVHA